MEEFAWLSNLLQRSERIDTAVMRNPKHPENGHWLCPSTKQIYIGHIRIRLAPCSLCTLVLHLLFQTDTDHYKHYGPRLSNTYDERSKCPLQLRKTTVRASLNNTVQPTGICRRIRTHILVMVIIT